MDGADGARWVASRGRRGVRAGYLYVRSASDVELYGGCDRAALV